MNNKIIIIWFSFLVFAFTLSGKTFTIITGRNGGKIRKVFLHKGKRSKIKFRQARRLTQTVFRVRNVPNAYTAEILKTKTIDINVFKNCQVQVKKLWPKVASQTKYMGPNGRSINYKIIKYQDGLIK